MKQLNYPISANTTDLGPTAEKSIGEDGIAYITGAPEMPRLEASIGGGSLSGMTVEWRVEVKTERSERGTKDDFTIPETDVIEKPIGEAWEIHEDYAAPREFFGGKVTVFYRIKKSGGGYLTDEQQITFKIRGKNPKDADAQNHIQSTQGSHRFAWAMAQHESRQGQRVYNHFNSGGSTKELPNLGPPDGWGIAQLDRPLGVSANTKEVYSWHANVEKFYAELNEKQAAQQRYFDAIQRTYPSQYQAPPANFVHPGTSTSMTALEAGIITLYNGVEGCPTASLIGASGKRVVFKNPWKFTPSAPSGQRWSYHPNKYNYLKKVIYDEFEGNLSTQE